MVPERESANGLGCADRRGDDGRGRLLAGRDTLLGLELVVALGVTVLVCGVLARRFGVAPPVLLLACGALLGFAPALRGVHLPPDVVLLLFLPALLYWESLTTSLREIRSNLRVIVLLSTALVILTAWAVAATAHALGLGWGPAWVLGAAVAPTDATAVGTLAAVLPRRTLTVLRAESLVNDGTALVIYSLAVGITAGAEHLSALYTGWLLLRAYGGGALAGAVTAWLAVRVRRHLGDPLLENVAILLIPFTAFLLAEAIHASGVLAVVVCGLIMSQADPRVGHPGARQQSEASWSLAAFVLNGALFVLVGLELQSAVRGLTSVDLVRGVIAVVGVSAAVIGAVRLGVHHDVPDPGAGPPPAAAATPGRRPRPGGQRGRRVPRRRVAGRRPRGPGGHRVRRALPRPRPDHLRDRRGHRGDAGAARPGAAGCGALGPAASRHLR